MAITVTRKTVVRVGAYLQASWRRPQCYSSAMMAGRASPDKRKDIAQDPANESSDTERG
jgi:hypothetical protein